MLIKLAIQVCEDDGTPLEHFDFHNYVGPLPKMDKEEAIYVIANVENAAFKAIEGLLLDGVPMNFTNVQKYPVADGDTWKDKWANNEAVQSLLKKGALVLVDYQDKDLWIREKTATGVVSRRKALNENDDLAPPQPLQLPDGLRKYLK